MRVPLLISPIPQPSILYILLYLPKYVKLVNIIKTNYLVYKIVYIKLISLSSKKVYVYDKFMTIKKTNLLISLDIF